jgi:hypothetical protein
MLKTNKNVFRDSPSGLSFFNYICNMKTFRLPRKIKKKLNGFYLLPPDSNGNRQWCNPKSSQEEYNDVKSGRAEDMIKVCKKNKILYEEKNIL